MNLAAGTRLGPYEIQSQLGAGGMGEVYKTGDTHLERTVGDVKVVAEFAKYLAVPRPKRLAYYRLADPGGLWDEGVVVLRREEDDDD